MIFNHSKAYLSWPILLALLILAVPCGILFGGMKDLIKYDNGTTEKMNYNLVNLHLSTRIYLTRQFQKFTAEQLPAVTNLPSFNIFVDEKDLESLELDLPVSAKLQFVQSHIKVDNPEFSSEAKIRYRGGLDLHWLYEKNQSELNYRHLAPIVVNANLIWSIPPQSILLLIGLVMTWPDRLDY